MKYRHEIKHEISLSDMLAIRAGLSAVAKPDRNGPDGKYCVRSLYFDDLNDTALKEKINGVNQREKFRIRLYNNDPSFIRLEKKSKINGLCNKQSAPLSADEAQKIIDGNYGWMISSEHGLIREFYSKIAAKRLIPRTVVDYTREAFVFPAGNVRITLDYSIRTGLNATDFLSAELVTVPAGEAPIILEVKWDEFLPEIIKNVIQTGNCRAGAFSKYAACRIYG